MATRGAELLAYHERTKHSAASVYGGGHHLDWANMPRPFKVFPALDPIPLPRDFTTSTRPAVTVLEECNADRAIAEMIRVVWSWLTGRKPRQTAREPQLEAAAVERLVDELAEADNKGKR